MHVNKEIRKVPAAFLDPIAEILEDDEAWKKVMSLIPKNLESVHFEPKYNTEHIKLIKRHAQDNRLKHAKVLFDEWGTSGRIRPTLQTLFDILVKAEMIRAAETLAKMINVKLPPRPTDGPGAHICTDVTSILNSMSSEQNINTRELNRTEEHLCNVPTKKIGSATLPESIERTAVNSEENTPNFDVLCPHPTAMIPKRDNVANVSDLIQFSKEESALVPSSEYMPRFSELIPGGESTNISFMTNMSNGSAANSETSQSTSDSIALSERSLSSEFQIPSQVFQVYSEILEDSNLIKFKYVELEAITKNFTGTHVGRGGFGEVFVGKHEKHGQLAIKRAHINQSMQINSTSADTIRFFNSEVKSLSVLRHKNIVPIIGISLDGPAPCIICKYIERGSLLENIAAKVLDEGQRMNIMIGTAEGLKYIHNTENPMVTGRKTTSRKAYLLHGDVKSANILINKDYEPMLCDFGLSKQCATTIHTESIMGTSAYMAPERFSGTITQKGDIFSFGIVLLELLTGLEPIISTEDNERFNIKMYVEEECIDGNIKTVLDPKIENWSKAQSIYDLAKLCMKNNKNKRPSVNELCEILHKINDSERRVFYADV